MNNRGLVEIATTSDFPGQVEVRRAFQIEGPHWRVHSVMYFTPEEAQKVRDGLDGYLQKVRDELDGYPQPLEKG